MEYVNVGIVVTIVLGLTQWIKERLSLDGRPAEILSFVVGAGFGGVYQFSITQPTDLQGWLAVVFVGVLMALVPSGLFQFASQIASKAASK